MAARKKLKRNPSVSEKDVDDALRVLRADYYSDVNGVAQNVLERMIEDVEGAEGNYLTREQISDIMHESVDGTQRVIYTNQARVGLICTDNQDAYVEEFGELPVEGDSIKWEAMMFAAMEKDTYELLGTTDFDADDLDTWGPALKELKGR